MNFKAKNKYFYFFLMLIILPAGVCSTGKSQTRAQILDVIPDARSIGMGGAFTAVADDAATLFYNPAGLATIRHAEVPLARNYIYINLGKMFKETDQMYYGIVFNLDGLKIANVRNPGTIAVTHHWIDDGYLPARDAAGNLTGELKADDRVLTLGYGKPILDISGVGTFMIGSNAKFYRERVDGFTAKGEAYDLGALFKMPRYNLSFGLAVKNIGKKVVYVGQGFDLPFRTVFGVSAILLDGRLLTAADFSKMIHDDVKANLGAEFWFTDAIGFRLGHNLEVTPDLGLTAGWGIRLKNVRVVFLNLKEIDMDYSHATHGEFGTDFSLQRFSMNIKFELGKLISANPH